MRSTSDKPIDARISCLLFRQLTGARRCWRAAAALACHSCDEQSTSLLFGVEGHRRAASDSWIDTTKQLECTSSESASSSAWGEQPSQPLSCRADLGVHKSISSTATHWYQSISIVSILTSTKARLERVAHVCSSLNVHQRILRIASPSPAESDNPMESAHADDAFLGGCRDLFRVHLKT